MAPSDSITSGRSLEKGKGKGKGKNNDRDKATKSDNGKEKENQKLRENKNLSKSQQKLQEREQVEQQQEEELTQGRGGMSAAPEPAVERSEEIQDLKDLLHQQQSKQEKAKAKRLEYDLDVHGGERSTLAATDARSTGDPKATQAGERPPQAAEPEKDDFEDVAAPAAKPSEAAEVEEAGDQDTQVEAKFGSVVPDTPLSAYLELTPEDMNQIDRVIAPSTENIYQENSTLARLEGQGLLDTQAGALTEHRVAADPTLTDTMDVEPTMHPM